jgi:leader peptidase (prepilin peptidase)/N-methyltransferase
MNEIMDVFSQWWFFALLFVFGGIWGSFINVIALRYDPDKFIIGRGILTGRSSCPSCGKTLRWYELIPWLSFAIQGGRCRRCRVKISWRYPAVETVSGLVMVAVWQVITNHFFATGTGIPLAALWIAVFELLLLMALIDQRHKIIPEEINIAIAACGIGIVSILSTMETAVFQHSFLGGYSLLFGGQSGLLINRVIAMSAAVGYFGVLLLATKGRGIGMGDLKLCAVMSIAFGWPDTVFMIALAFVIGAAWSAILVLRNKKRLKSAVPFGPFIDLAALATVLAGEKVLGWYFSLFTV